MSARYQARYYRNEPRPFLIVDADDPDRPPVFTFAPHDRTGAYQTLDRLNGATDTWDLHPAARSVLHDHGIDLPDEEAA